MNNEKLTYSDAGVDIEEGAKAVEQMKKYVHDTFTKGVIGGLGGFSGMFMPDISGYKNPVLVSGTDGVGTKLKLAFMMDKHDTVGVDLVAMCVNDILCQGAKPLFFLDYIATGKLKADKIACMVKGIADGCKQAECALIGGETAEMPGFYPEGEYDMAGFTVGIVDRDKIIDGATVKNGDVLVGIASSGIHSNGYSLVRKLLFEKLNMSVDTYVERLGAKLGDVLIEPTKIYVKPVLKMLKHFEIKSMCHITGGGFIENLPRIIPNELGININLGSWDVPEIFSMMKEMGNIPTEEMYKTFNMGIGYIFIVDKSTSEPMMDVLGGMGEKCFKVGEVTDKVRGVVLCER